MRRCACGPSYAGRCVPPLSQPLQLGWRAGLDLHPVDVQDPDATELAARADLAGRHGAAAAARAGGGDGQKRSPAAAHRQRGRGPPGSGLHRPAGDPAGADHDYALAHFTPEDRRAFAAIVGTLARTRPLWWLTTAGSNELDRGGVELRARRLMDGAVVDDHLLCTHHPHGLWLRLAGRGDRGSPGPGLTPAEAAATLLARRPQDVERRPQRSAHRAGKGDTQMTLTAPIRAPISATSSARSSAWSGTSSSARSSPSRTTSSTTTSTPRRSSRR